MLVTCDGSGNIASTASCALGCGSDGAHCNVMVPSNGLQAALDMVPSPQDIDLQNGDIDLLNGTFTPTGGSAMALGFIPVPGGLGSAEINVLVGHRVTLGNVTIAGEFFGGGTAFGVIATSDITISGTLDMADIGVGSSCAAGDATQASQDGHTYFSGGGGGGFGTAGGSGGSVTTIALGGSGGSASGNETLIPLRGGCPGGVTSLFGKGGGAIQLSSATSIAVNGPITADALAAGAFFGEGGGAGGAILLEAPIVDVSATGRLFVRGAGGKAANSATGTTQADALFQPGGTCGSACGGDGGNGASLSTPAQPGQDYHGTFGEKDDGAGGGGGGLGRIRINTADGTFNPAVGALISGVLTSGPLLRN
jgi:hypothetical protein